MPSQSYIFAYIDRGVKQNYASYHVIGYAQRVSQGPLIRPIFEIGLDIALCKDPFDENGWANDENPLANMNLE